jgi:hypothetical protein
MEKVIILGFFLVLMMSQKLMCNPTSHVLYVMLWKTNKFYNIKVEN